MTGSNQSASRAGSFCARGPAAKVAIARAKNQKRNYAPNHRIDTMIGL
jgi:hypothetical protein